MKVNIFKNYDEFAEELLKKTAERELINRIALCSFWKEYLIETFKEFDEDLRIVISNDFSEMDITFKSTVGIKASIKLTFSTEGYTIELYGLPLNEKDRHLHFHKDGDIRNLAASIEERIQAIAKWFAREVPLQKLKEQRRDIDTETEVFLDKYVEMQGRGIVSS